MRSFYGQFVRPGDLCFDVGANMGNRTATLLDVGARVICVEPQHACVRKLRKLYGKNPNVVIVEAALGEKEGGGALAICEEEPAISTMSDKWRQEGRFAGSHTWVKTVPVVVTTLNQLITLYGRPVFCKIDVEGFEVSVLKGLSRPIPLISFEFTRELFTDAKACMDRLLSLGPAVFNASFGESMTFVQEEWMSPEALTRRIDAEDDLLLWGDIYAKKM
jgi:FkbM family methyltransferase